MYCGLEEHCESPKMFAQGKGEKKILILSNNPGETDDDEGIHFVGKGGQLLRETLGSLGVDIEDDCISMCAVACHSDKVTSTEIEACRIHVMQEIQKSKPSLILCLGSDALESLLEDRVDSVGSINKWRGFVYPDRRHNCWVAPLFDLKYMAKNGGKKDVSYVIFKKDVKNALQYVGEALPPYCSNEEDCVSILNERQAISRIKQLLKRDFHCLIAFDYETNCLKPEIEGAAIKCCSIATGPYESLSFMWTPSIASLMQRVLKKDSIRKIASNMKFEERWSRTILNTPVAGWFHDTMMMMHVMDNRPDITSIKHIARLYFGLFKYDSYMDQFWTNTGATELNSIDKADPHKLLLYCGLDSLLEYRACLIQRYQNEDPRGIQWRMQLEPF